MTLQHKFLYFVNWSKFILSNKNIFHQREVKSFSSVVRCSLAVSKAGPQGHWGCTSWEPWNKPSPFFLVSFAVRYLYAPSSYYKQKVKNYITIHIVCILWEKELFLQRVYFAWNKQTSFFFFLQKWWTTQSASLFPQAFVVSEEYILAV